MALLLSELNELNAIINERPLTRFEYRAAERSLQVLIEACIGIAKHWSKSLLGVAPADAYSAFQRLSEKGIDQVNQVDWRLIIGMRNALVHDYLNIDTAVVEQVVRERHYMNIHSFALSGLQALNPQP